MHALGWTDALAVGHAKIDHDHRQLLEAINRLMRAAERPDGHADCDREFDRLIARTWEHFALEESLMQLHHTPDEAAHKRQHERLMDELIVLKAHYDDGSMSIPANLQAALHGWLARHIAQCDRPLAAHIRAAVAAAGGHDPAKNSDRSHWPTAAQAFAGAA